MFLLLLSFCFLFPEYKLLFTNNALLNFDAQHYYYISQHGYEGFRAAFFPLFPLVWKMTGNGVILITIINSSVFLLSFSALTAFLEVEQPLELILLASVPCLMFMFIPYSESLFFACGTMLLIGLKKNISMLVCVGILLCGITRPTATVFIPAILLTVFLSNDFGVRKTKIFLTYSLFALAGLGISLLIQHSDTGNWFAFFDAQKGWGNELRIPKLPFSSWAGGKIVRLDAGALLVGFFSLGFILKMFLLKLKQKIYEISSEIIFSISCLAGIALLILFFRGGSFFSLNRFVYATPFFTVALTYFCRNYSFTYKQIGIFFLSSSLFWLLFGSFVHIQYLLKFELLSLFLTTYFLLNNRDERLKKAARFVVIAINSILLVYFYYRFISNEWVG